MPLESFDGLPIKSLPFISIREQKLRPPKNPHSPQALTLNIFTHILKLNSIQQFSAISVMAEALKHTVTANKNTPLSMHGCNLATQKIFL